MTRKSYRELRKENKELQENCVALRNLAASVNQALQFNAAEADRLINHVRKQSIVLLGGVALQHQGEILIKDEFMQMITNPEYRLQVIIERNEDNTGTCVRTVEAPVENKDNNAENKE
jgi:tRNA A37 threonylcarbamoyltransferase TsaD